MMTGLERISENLSKHHQTLNTLFGAIQQCTPFEKKTFDLEKQLRRHLKSIPTDTPRLWFEKSHYFSKPLLPPFQKADKDTMVKYFDQCWSQGSRLECNCVLADLLDANHHFHKISRILRHPDYRDTLDLYDVVYDLTPWDTSLKRCYLPLMDRVHQMGFTQTLSRQILNDLKVLGFQTLPQFHDLRLRYLELAKKHHPDKGGEPSYFQIIQHAYHRIAKSFPAT